MFPPPAGPHIALHFLLPSHATRGVWTRRPQQETISVSLACLTVLGVCHSRPQEATTTAPAEDPKEVRVNWTRGDEGLPARDTGRTAFSASRADCRAQYRHQEEQHLCPNRTHIYRDEKHECSREYQAGGLRRQFDRRIPRGSERSVVQTLLSRLSQKYSMLASSNYETSRFEESLSTCRGTRRAHKGCE